MTGSCWQYLWLTVQRPFKTDCSNNLHVQWQYLVIFPYHVQHGHRLFNTLSRRVVGQILSYKQLWSSPIRKPAKPVLTFVCAYLLSRHYILLRNWTPRISQRNHTINVQVPKLAVHYPLQRTCFFSHIIWRSYTCFSKGICTCHVFVSVDLCRQCSCMCLAVFCCRTHPVQHCVLNGNIWSPDTWLCDLQHARICHG